jgi:hypothetical protein
MVMTELLDHLLIVNAHHRERTLHTYLQDRMPPHGAASGSRSADLVRRRRAGPAFLGHGAAKDGQTEHG